MGPVERQLYTVVHSQLGPGDREHSSCVCHEGTAQQLPRRRLLPDPKGARAPCSRDLGSWVLNITVSFPPPAMLLSKEHI